MAEKINKYEAIAPQILELVGGKDNIRSFAHCMTRLRFNVKDKGLWMPTRSANCPAAWAHSGR